MNAQIKFLGEVVIPQELPHGGPTKSGEDAPDFYRDYVRADADGSLVLISRCGKTVFPPGSWSNGVDIYRVSSGTVAVFAGAWGALNAVAGVQFSVWELAGEIESSFGRFATVEGYMEARRLHGREPAESA